MPRRHRKMKGGFLDSLGSTLSGVIIDNYFILSNGEKDWHGIWLVFAIYSLVVAIAFAFLFRHTHDPEVELNH